MGAQEKETKKKSKKWCRVTDLIPWVEFAKDREISRRDIRGLDLPEDSKGKYDLIDFTEETIFR